MTAEFAAARNRRPFLKGLGLALCAIVPIVAITATSGADPEAAGARAGTLAVAPFLAGVAVGVWAKLATRRWRPLDYVLRFALSTVVFFGLNALGQGLIKAAAPRARPAAVLPLTEAEKQGLYVSRGEGATHTLLAFDVPLRGKWDLLPEVQTEINRSFEGMPGMFAWALQSEKGDELAVIYVAKGFGDDEAEFRAMAQGISRGVGKQGVHVLEEALRWDRHGKEFRHGVRIADGRFARTRCVPSESELILYTLCVQTLSPESTGLDNARNHLLIRVRKQAWDSLRGITP